MPKTYTKQWKHAGSIIRQRGDRFQVETSHNGKRARHTEETLDDAKLYAEQKQTEIKNQGIAAFALTKRQKEDAFEALNILQGIDDGVDIKTTRVTPLAEAARFWTIHNRPTGGAVPMDMLLPEYLEAKRKRNLRPPTLWELDNKLGRFVGDFADRHIHTITTDDIDSWLDSNTDTAGTRNKYRTLLNGLFRYAKEKRKLIEVNPIEHVDTAKKDADDVEVYTVEEVQALLSTAQEEYPRIVPPICIGLFAGLRPSEVGGLDWKEVDFKRKRIVVTKQTSKVRRKRFVKMSDNLAAWLLPYRKKSGPVSPPEVTMRRYRAKLIEKEAISKWIPDGLRHSFGSYHVAQCGDAGQTAHQMGHTSLRTLYKHYVDAVVEEDAKEYWDILPKAEGNVVKYPKAG